LAVLGVDLLAEAASSRLHFACYSLLNSAYELASITLCLAFSRRLLSAQVRFELARDPVRLSSSLALGLPHRRAQL
jgi:hypothetical protein